MSTNISRYFWSQIIIRHRDERKFRFSVINNLKAFLTMSSSGFRIRLLFQFRTFQVFHSREIALGAMVTLLRSIFLALGCRKCSQLNSMEKNVFRKKITVANLLSFTCLSWRKSFPWTRRIPMALLSFFWESFLISLLLFRLEIHSRTTLEGCQSSDQISCFAIFSCNHFDHYSFNIKRTVQHCLRCFRKLSIANWFWLVSCSFSLLCAIFALTKSCWIVCSVIQSHPHFLSSFMPTFVSALNVCFRGFRTWEKQRQTGQSNTRYRK